MKKNLIIIGSEGNLGQGIKNILLEKDYSKIYLVDRKNYERKYSSHVQKIQVDDLSNEKNIIKLFEKMSFKENELYFMISTVGGFSGGNSVDEIEISVFDRMININLKASFLLSKYFIQKVKHTKGGAICFTSALVSFNIEPSKSVYGLSKSALNYLIETLALENKENRISIFGVAPNILDTKENREWINKKTDLVSPKNIGIFVNSLFENYKIISGNIIKLFITLD